jgi:hypothetical protein
MEIDKNISYLIGLFQTDGSMYKIKNKNKGKFSIELSIKDKDIINKIKDYIPYNYSIRTRIRNIQLKDKDYISETIILTVSDMGFRKFLNESGIPYGKKSQIIKPPLHLHNLSIKDYIRGLYDGDGSLGLDSKGLPFISFATESDDIAIFLIEYISNITNKSKKKLNRNKRDNIYNIKLSNEVAQILSKEIYYDGCLSINRKYKKSKDILSWIRPNDMIKRDYEKMWWDNEQDGYILNHTIEESMEHLNRTEKSIKIRLWRLNNKK